MENGEEVWVVLTIEASKPPYSNIAPFVLERIVAVDWGIMIRLEKGNPKYLWVGDFE